MSLECVCESELDGVHAFARISDALHSPNPAGFHTLTGAAVRSPVHDAVSVQGHEVHLAAASRPH